MIGLVPDPRAGRRRDDLADAEPMLEALARSRPAAILQSEAPRSAGPCSDLSWPRIVAPDAKNLCCVWPKFDGTGAPAVSTTVAVGPRAVVVFVKRVCPSPTSQAKRGRRSS